MKKEMRTVYYDEELRIEAYHFEGIEQPFPNHFHEHYVIGFIEDGERCLSCKNKEYTIKKGNILIFNPGDNHACVQNGKDLLDFRGFNISKATMLDLSEEITGKRILPGFTENVIYNNELGCYLRSLHEMVMSGLGEFEKEEKLLLLISLLISNYGQPFENCVLECRDEIDKACKFIEKHYTEHIYMDQICKCAGLSKSALLRAFTKTKGITPYRYLQTIRVNEAKKLLEQGVTPVEAAMKTGFSDQSHFTNFFSTFIGLSPGVYREIFNAHQQKEPRGKE
jgi:AraC-like DNA-binding protein